MSSADARARAAEFLLYVNRQGGFIAQLLDPKGKRDYENEPLLKAAEGIAAKARGAVEALGLSVHANTDAEIIAKARGSR